MRSIGLAAIAVLTVIPMVPAGAADLQVKPVLKAPAPPPSNAGFWIGAEYLLWSAKGDKLPPLVTTSPPGTPLVQAGVLGAPGTTVLFGNDRVNDGWRSGARVSAGYWFDPRRTTGIEASFFILDRSATNFAASSGGTPILAQPFVDASTGLQQATLIAFPGLSSGSVAISDTSRLLGAGAVYRTEFCKTCAFGSVSGLIGYRFLRLRDNLAMNSTIVSLGGGAIPAGTMITTTDQFDTTNSFHGLDLGLSGEVANGPWKLMWLAKVAVGGTFADVDINGATTVASPGGGVVTGAGGFYALPTNMGRHSSNRFAVAPELGANVSYQINSNLRAFAGYSFLYWTGLVRPGGAIDSTINPSQIGGLPLVGPARPQTQFNTTDYWVQGVNVGLAYNF